MKKYIFLLFNLIYLIGFSTDVKNITRRLSDKQIENINSVEDFFYYENGNKLIQFKGDITVEVNKNNIPVWPLDDYEFADKIINSIDNKFILDKFNININEKKLDFFNEKDLIKIKKSNIRKKIENIEKNSNILKYYKRTKANYYLPSSAPKPNFDMVSSEFIWIAFSKSVLLIDVQGFEKFEKEVLSIPNVDKKIMELKEFIEYIDKIELYLMKQKKKKRNLKNYYLLKLKIAVFKLKEKLNKDMIIHIKRFTFIC